MKKRLLRTKFLSLAIAAFAVTGVFATASFLSASASDDVSPTDTEMQQLLYIDSAVFLQNQRCSHGHRFYVCKVHMRMTRGS